MNAILKAPVDLLFFGGIGTYVRASSETDDAVGDRANDAIRITGARAALQGDRRGRQSRHDPARPHRGGAARRAAQHRRHRQFGRRQHLRRRGQHQDRAQRRRCATAGSTRDDAQRAARRDDRRGRGARAAQQLPADAGALARRAARPRGPRLPAAADADAGGARAARPRGRVPARRHGDRRAPPARAAADPAGARGAARLCQARRSTTICSTSTVPDDPYLGRELGRYFPQADRASDSPTRSSSTGCAARSSRRSSPIR